MTPFELYMEWVRFWCSFWLPAASRIEGREGNVVKVNFERR